MAPRQLPNTTTSPTEPRDHRYDLRKRPFRSDNSEAEADEVGKKLQKLAANSTRTITAPLKAVQKEENVNSGGGHVSNHDLSFEWVTESEERLGSKKQMSLQLLLKLEISKLAQILELPEVVKLMVWRFLEYVIKNHHVNRDPPTILQAFQLSLCWVAASSVKHKIDWKQSLALAKKHLNFACKEEEACQVYSKLRFLKKLFSSRADNKNISTSKTDNTPVSEDIIEKSLDARASQSVALNPQHVKIEDEERLQNLEHSTNFNISHPEEAPKQDMTGKEVGGSEVAPADNTEPPQNETVSCSSSGDTSPALRANSEYTVETLASERISSNGIKQANGLGCSTDDCNYIASLNYPHKQILDGLVSREPDGEGLSEMLDTLPVASGGGTDTMESSAEKDGGDMISTDLPYPVGSHDNGMNVPINSDEASTDFSLVYMPSSEPDVYLIHDGVLPQNLANQECSSSVAPTQIPEEDTAFQEVEFLCLQPVDTGLNGQSGSGAQSIETHGSIGHNQSGVASASHHALPRDSKGVASLLLNAVLEDPARLSDVMQTGENLELHPSNASETHLNFNLHLGAGSGVDHEPTDAPTQALDHTTNLQNGAVLQPGVSLPALQGPSNNIAHETSQMSIKGLYDDPLQNELDRIHQEREQVIKMHDTMKLQLKSDCDKEIEETVAEIRVKYEDKLKDADTTFILKKNELDANHKMVLMNKIVAEEFRSNWLYLKLTGTHGVHEVGRPSCVQQLRQSQLQPSRPSAVTGAHLANQPIPRLVTATTAGQVHHPVSVSPGTVFRPPHIRLINPSAGNLRVGCEIRVPAPHLQPFRPVAASSISSLMSFDRGLPRQRAPNSSSMSSPSLSQLPLQPPTSAPRNDQQAKGNLPASALLQIRPAPPNDQQAKSNPPTSASLQIQPAAPPPAAALVPSLPANGIGMSSVSALGLLMDIDSQVGANKANIMAPVPDFGSNSDSLKTSQIGSAGSAQVGSASMDVVSLSDDD